MFFEQYKEYCNNHIDNPAAMMGKSFMSPADGIKKFPNAVIHVIAEMFSEKDFILLRDRGLKILILGYKHFGRGNDCYDAHGGKASIKHL